jgi:acyl-[acyl-carrier-protein]-phospholipid O-acyltransferase/long-chain-fatty-acid--[acyl-carrier-protein] ligase
MVSLSTAEALASSIWQEATHVVVAMPDARKGERLLLVTTQRNAGSGMLLSAARDRGIGEIMVPREVMVVDKLPLLGTGKTDYPAVQKLAELCGSKFHLDVEADAAV